MISATGKQMLLTEFETLKAPKRKAPITEYGPMFQPQPYLEGQPFPLRFAIQRQLWAEQIAQGPVTRRMNLDTLAAVITGQRPLKVISNGAGVDSEFMTIWGIQDKNLEVDMVMFADTGDELPETYAMVSFMKKWVEDRGIPFVIVANHYGKTLTQYFHDHHVIPSKQKRDCTGKFKIDPMRRFLRETFGDKATFIKYVGYNADEKRRVDRASEAENPSYEIVQYPVYHAGVTRAQELEYLRNLKTVPVAEKSGCFDCIFTVKAGWAMLKAKYPALFAEAKRFDEDSNEHKKSKAGYYKDKKTGKPRGFYLSGGRDLASLEAEFEANPISTAADPDTGKQVFIKCDGTIITTDARLGSK